VRDLKQFRYQLEWVGVSFFARLIPALPASFLRFLASLLGALFFRFDRRTRQVTLANLEVALGDRLSRSDRERIGKKSIQIFARSFLEFFWTPRLNRRNLPHYVSFEDPEAFATMMAEGRQAAIFVTMHFGNFEWGSALLGFNGCPGHILTQRFKNDRLTPIFARIREISGSTVLTQERSMIRLLKLAKQRQTIGILIDLTLKMTDPGIIIDTFGLLMRTTMLEAVLHRRTGVPIQPFLTLPRADGGWLLRLFPPLNFPSTASDQEIVQGCWNVFEPVIRQYPEQWLWSYKHWRYRPEKADRPYPFYAKVSQAFEQELAKRNLGSRI
jgi:KDO2-lipid IV(A) lauroyltransferase